ncbi:MAG: hypothetical protein COA78_21260 [Blastopirellula sp.]|nr:MAG: hypothetical protein COA78_21260 [Blastopirellula sp.]
MTITELLATSYYRGNKSLLAEELNVNRATIKLYAGDLSGKHHFVKPGKNKLIGGELFTNQSNKVNK